MLMFRGTYIKIFFSNFHDKCYCKCDREAVDPLTSDQSVGSPVGPKFLAKRSHNLTFLVNVRVLTLNKTENPSKDEL